MIQDDLRVKIYIFCLSYFGTFFSDSKLHGDVRGCAGAVPVGTQRLFGSKRFGS